MKNYIILLLIIVFSFVVGQEETLSDTLLSNQKQMLKNQEQLLKEVEYIDPLKDKRFGIEFNPAYFLISSTGDEGLTITGTFSLFSISKTAEIAFPYYYTQSGDFSEISIDCHYRNFLGKHRNGFYISSGLRFTKLKGIEGFSFFGSNFSESNEITSTNKLGLTFGIGYRRFGNNGWYWGTSLFGGRYFSDDETNYVNSNMSGSKIIVDFELLKIGRLF